MPEELQEARIDAATFMKAQAVVSKYHRIGFPLRFWQNTKHVVDDAAAIRLMEGVCRTDMPPVRLLRVRRCRKQRAAAQCSERASFPSESCVLTTAGRLRSGGHEASVFCVTCLEGRAAMASATQPLRAGAGSDFRGDVQGRRGALGRRRDEQRDAGQVSAHHVRGPRRRQHAELPHQLHQAQAAVSAARAAPNGAAHVATLRVCARMWRVSMPPCCKSASVRRACVTNVRGLPYHCPGRRSCNEHLERCLV